MMRQALALLWGLPPDHAKVIMAAYCLARAADPIADVALHGHGKVSIEIAGGKFAKALVMKSYK